MDALVPEGPPELGPDAARALLRLLRRLAERRSPARPAPQATKEGARGDGLGGDMRRAS